jgi:DNA repair exonuclease SbcCD ATPase subunit
MIKLISVENFRGHTRTFEFGNGLNELIGPNESGKSTINEAISFVLYGYDSNGTKNPDHLITIGKDTMSAALTTDKATFTRRKKRGTTSKIILSRAGTPDTELKNMDDVVRLFGAEFDTFASGYNAGYFMRLPDAKRLEVLNSVIKIDRKALYLELGGQEPLPSVVKLEDPRKEAGYVAQERRKIQNQFEGHKGRITQLTQERAILSQGDVDVKAATAEIARLEARAALLSAYDSAAIQHHNAVRYMKEVAAHNAKSLAEKERIELELKSMQAERDIKSIQSDMSGVADQIAKLKSQIRNLPLEPKKVTAPNAGVSCPQCGQVVSDKAAKSIIDGYDAAVLAYNNECRAILDANKVVEDSVAMLNKQHSDMFTDMQNELTASSARAALKGQLSGLVLRTVDPAVMELAAKAPTLPSTGHSMQECSRLVTELKAKILSANGAASRVKQIDEQGVELDRQAQAMAASIDALSIVEDILVRMPEIEAERKIQSLQTESAVIAIRDGALTVADKNMCPYYSMSSGRKMKFDIEMCRKIQSFQPKRPNFYFIDNEDLIDDVTPWLPADAQVFIARVDANETELQIRKTQ